MADSNLHYMNGTFLMFATHDYSINNTGFDMRDWYVWNSIDLVRWSLASVVKPQETLHTWSGNRTDCWATDGAFRNNMYYFYLSVGGAQVAVVRAPSPMGPWEDPLGKPLLDAGMAPTTFRDPCVFEDPDSGDFFIIAGVFQYYIAKLNQDMISLAEPLRHVEVVAPYGPCGYNTTDDKPFIHKQAGFYYLSWGCFYGMSKSVYGPYVTKGSVIDTALLDPSFRMNQTVTPWYRMEDYTDRHGSFLHHDGQWFYASNDRSHSGDLPNPGNFRDTVVCYIHFREDGTMAPCKVDGTGVGMYDAQDWIEAENYMKLAGPTGASRKVHLGSRGNRTDGGGVGDAFGVEMVSGTAMDFPHIFGIPTPHKERKGTAASIELISSGAETLSSGWIEVLSKADGEVVAVCEQPLGQYSQRCSLGSSWQRALNSAGELELTLRYDSGGMGIRPFTLDKFRLHFSNT